MKNFLNLAALTLSTGLVLMAGASHAQTSLVGSFTAAGNTVAHSGTVAYNNSTLATSTSITFSFGNPIIAFTPSTGLFASSGKYSVNLVGTGLAPYSLILDPTSTGAGYPVTYTFGSAPPEAITFAIKQTGTANVENFSFTANDVKWYGIGTSTVYLTAAGALTGTGVESLGLPSGSPYDNSEIDFTFKDGSAVAVAVYTPEPGVVALVIGFSAPLAGFGLRRRRRNK